MSIPIIIPNPPPTPQVNWAQWVAPLINALLLQERSQNAQGLLVPLCNVAQINGDPLAAMRSNGLAYARLVIDPWAPRVLAEVRATDGSAAVISMGGDTATAMALGRRHIDMASASRRIIHPETALIQAVSMFALLVSAAADPAVPSGVGLQQPLPETIDQYAAIGWARARIDTLIGVRVVG